MKAVLLSIRPNWCKLIWSGMKTVDVRKTRPKLETPFKVYIYCTGAGNWWQRFPKTGLQQMEERVIGTFVCDKIDRLTHIGATGSSEPVKLYIETSDLQYEYANELLQAACLTEAQAEKYLKGGDGYGWHISGLKIWDEPVRLKDFWAIQPCSGKCHTCRRCDAKTMECKGEHLGIDRPPQSWCYVEVGG
nr:MAG TPA: helix-turn-helix domain-containing protein [Bacteriophage sp.]